MSRKPFNGLFISEGSSDIPLARIAEALFFERGIEVFLSSPDFGLLSAKVRKDVGSRLAAGIQLVGGPIDLVVVHRDADSAGDSARRAEIERAAGGLTVNCAVIPVIPVRMTEAWLLLDERAIRRVAGNPNGKAVLPLPKASAAEAVADPKDLLRQCLLTAAEVSGRRRDAFAKRFNQHRRQLLERLDLNGAVKNLESWGRLLEGIDKATGVLTGQP